MKKPKNTRIVCFGELLIDMISVNPGSLVQSQGFHKNAGGAPANTAVDIARLGVPVSFIGKVGNDPFGHFLKQTLEKNKVDTTSLIVSKNDYTTLALVSREVSGKRHFFFYRGAHENISPDEVSLPKNTFLFHFGSLTQTDEKINKTTQKLLRLAKKTGAIISYDPNYREHLWRQDLKGARIIILETAKKVDILKVNEEEAGLLSGTNNPKEASRILFTKNLSALFITLGPKGTYYKTEKYEGTLPTIKVKVTNTIGAGDAFNAGYITALYEMQKNISQLSFQELLKTLKRALIISALTTTKEGAISASLPGPKEILKYERQIP